MSSVKKRTDVFGIPPTGHTSRKDPSIQITCFKELVGSRSHPQSLLKALEISRKMARDSLDYRDVCKSQSESCEVSPGGQGIVHVVDETLRYIIQ